MGEEKHENLKNTLYMHKRFINLGFKVAMTRLDDSTVTPAKRGARIAASGAKLCISNHFNGATASAKGFETFRSIYAKPTWGGLVGKYVQDAGVLAYRGCKTRKNASGTDYYFMHRTTGMTQTLIIEYFFGTNKEDTENYKTKRIQYLEAVIKATCEYCDVPYKEV